MLSEINQWYATTHGEPVVMKRDKEKRSKCDFYIHEKRYNNTIDIKS